MTEERAVTVRRIINELKTKRDKVVIGQHKLLEEEGWTRTRATPDFRWAWVKKLKESIKLNGEEVFPVVIVNTEVAMLYVEQEMELCHPGDGKES